MDVDTSRCEVDPVEVRMSHSGSGHTPRTDMRDNFTCHNCTFLLAFRGESALSAISHPASTKTLTL